MFIYGTFIFVVTILLIMIVFTILSFIGYFAKQRARKRNLEIRYLKERGSKYGMNFAFVEEMSRKELNYAKQKLIDKMKTSLKGD